MNENEELDKLVEETTTKINQKSTVHPRNRAERRALEKKLGKQGRLQMDLISDTTKKLNYIDLIQKLRKLNKEKENEENNESINSTQN